MNRATHNGESRTPGIRSRVVGFLADDRGDDMVEYALLTTFIGLMGVVAMNVLRTAILNSYTSWDTAQQNLYAPPNP